MVAEGLSMRKLLWRMSVLTMPRMTQGMGFSRQQAAAALEGAGGDLAAATDLLLGGS